LKILHVVASVNRATGGPAVSVTSLAGAQARLGHEVTLACLDYDHLGPQVRVPDGVRLVSQKGNFLTVHGRGWSPRFARRLEELARGVDVVHDHGLWMWPNKYARVAAGKAGKPLVISPRGMLEDWSLGRSKMRKRVAWMLFEKENLRSAKLFHATSVSEAESIEKNLSFTVTFTFTKPRIVVAPNGVEIPQRIPKREVVEEKFPELKGRRFVLFMSRIHPKKGLDVLLEAWRQQQRDGRLRLRLRLRDGQEVEQEAVLVIAGADLVGYGEEVKRMIREKGLEGGVVMTGHVDGEVREALLGHAEFMVLPSHSENFGLVVAESLAAGRPVVTTNKTPWGSELAQGDRRKEIADRGSMNLELRGCGVICEVTDLKRGLERMLQFSDKEREEMGARGREWMREEFSWEAGAETILEAYKAIAGK
jgi:glycosyltransferase involved in cell wall biosynthesis